MPLSLEQFKGLRNKGLSTEQITKFESGDTPSLQVEQPKQLLQKKPGFLDVAAGITPQEQIDHAAQMYQAGRPFEATLSEIGAASQRAGQDVVAIPANFFNQMLLNLPRSAIETMGYKYPADAENNMAQFLAKTGGVVGAFKSPAVRLLGGLDKIGKSAKIPLIARSAIGGATAGALYSPEDFTDIEARKSQAKVGALFGAALPVVTRAATEAGPAGGKLLRKMGQVSSRATKWIKQRGPERIFTPQKEKVDYVKTFLAPKVHKIYQENLKNFTKPIQKLAKEKFNIPEKSVDLARDKGYNAIYSTRARLGDSTDDIYSRIQGGLQGKKNEASNLYKTAINELPDNSLIRIDKTYKNLEGLLKQFKFIDDAGNLTQRADKANASGSAYKRLIDLWQDMKFTLEHTGKRGGRHISGRIAKTDFQLYREELTRMYNDTPTDRLVIDVMDNLYDDGERAGMKGIGKARSMYKKALNMFDDFSERFKEKKLDKYSKLPQEDVRNLKNIEDFTGNKFIDDLSELSAARDLDRMDKLTVEALGQKLQSATDPRNTESVKKGMRDVFGDYTDEIFNDIRDHVTAQELATKFASPSRAGFLRSGTRSMLREYYENVYPVIEKGKQLKSLIRKK